MLTYFTQIFVCHSINNVFKIIKISPDMKGEDFQIADSVSQNVLHNFFYILILNKVQTTS